MKYYFLIVCLVVCFKSYGHEEKRLVKMIVDSAKSSNLVHGETVKALDALSEKVLKMEKLLITASKVIESHRRNIVFLRKEVKKLKKGDK